MISSFFPSGVNKNREISAAPLPELYGGNEQYLYIPNWFDQTVSVIDTDTDTVVTTITLTSSKSFTGIIYRAVDESVYVFGAFWFDRIDANPSSGTFNTVVESGASLVNDTAMNLTYIPWPLDLICNSGANVRFHRFADKNSVTAAGKQFTITARNAGNYGAGGDNLGQATFGHAVGWARLAPKAGLLFFRSEQSYKYKILHSTKDIQSNGPYTFVQESWQMDLDRNGVVGNGYIFDNMVIPSSSSASYKQIRSIDTAPLGAGLGGSVSGPSFAEYCPINGRGATSGLHCYAGKTSTLISVFEIGFNTYNDLGDINRTAYKAANETGTDAMIFNHRNNKLYVRGYNGGTVPGTCDLIHVYDMTQPFGSMYLTSITVGNLQSTAKQHNNPTNNMIFNQTKYYEANGVTI